MMEIQTGVIKPVEIFKEAWTIIKDDYWLLFAISLVGMLIGGISFYILVGAMICGIYYAFLKKIDGEKVALDDLWKGFQYVVPSLLVTILIVVPMFVVFGIIYAPIIMAAVMGSKLSEDELLGMIFGALAVDFVIILIMTCFHTLLIFAFPLIVDKNLGAWEAITTSAKGVWRNLSGIAGMIGVAFLATIPVSMITCGLGVYLLLPLMLASYALAYRKIFLKSDRNFNPPPPNAYQNL
jgi:hypothetical protein